MSDTYDEGNDPIRPMTDEESAMLVSSMFTSTAVLSRVMDCDDPDCDTNHDEEELTMMIPFLEMEVYYEEGGKCHAFLPVQLLPGLIEAAAKCLAVMFPGWGSLTGEEMEMPDTIEGWSDPQGDNHE